MALQEELRAHGDFLFKNRSYLPVVILIIALIVHAHSEYYEVEAADTWLKEYWEYLCLLVSLLGLFIRIVTIGYTPKNTSGRNTRVGQRAEKLNTTGFYSIVRHPLYLGNFFMWLGIAMLTSNLWFTVAFLLFYAFYYERIMYAEESFLRKKFKDTYLFWARKTPAFIPSFKNFRKVEYSFCFKKVLRNEKNGFTAVFLLFWLFEFVGEYAETGRIGLVFDFWFFAAITSLQIYIILKLLKKKGYLNEIER